MPRGNPKNMRPVTLRSKEEALEMSRRGGIASGISRKRKKEAKEAAEMFLNLTATGQLETLMKDLGINKKECTNQMGIIVRHVLKAQHGDEKSARLIFELTKDLAKPQGDNNVVVNTNNDMAVAELDSYINKLKNEYNEDAKNNN